MRTGLPASLVLAAAIAIAAMLGGCGAKTGLSARDDAGAADDAGRDVGPPMDGGFDTFPCRWSYSEAIEVARGDLDTSYGALKAAIALRREQAMVLAGDVGGVTDLADSPSVLHEATLDDASGDFSGFDEGWLQVRSEGERCTVVERDESLGVVSMGRTLLAAPCFVDDNDGSDTLITAVGGGQIRVRKPAGGRFFEIDAEASYARTVRMRDGGVLIAALRGDRIDAYAVTARGDEIRAPDLARQPVPFVAAPDRLRGGMIVLRFGSGPGDPWHLERLRVEGGEIRLSSVTDLSSLPAQPFTSLATNETEALIPLTNGALAYVPLNDAEPRVLEPVPERAVTSMVVALRPGESTGGLAYTTADPAGSGQILYFRPIVCNR